MCADSIIVVSTSMVYQTECMLPKTYYIELHTVMYFVAHTKVMVSYTLVCNIYTSR